MFHGLDVFGGVGGQVLQHELPFVGVQLAQHFLDGAPVIAAHGVVNRVLDVVELSDAAFLQLVGLLLALDFVALLE